ncbi:MAG: DUF4271 domain-containing protein [Bacteroidetes bacterium]|nr:DUF4271 domain-containing protein [Bacteroidota bacterium]
MTAIAEAFKPDTSLVSTSGVLLHGNDGSWELYPPLQRVPVGKLVQTEQSPALVVVPRNNDSQTPYSQWLGNIVLISFALMVFFRLTYPRRFTQFFKAALSNKGMFQLLREWSPMNILSLLFSLMHTIGFAIFIYAGATILGSTISFTNKWIIDILILSAITTFVVYGKYLTILILAWMFQLRESGRRYLSNQIVFSFLISLLLFPVLLSIIYKPSTGALITSGVLLALLQGFRLARSFAIGLSERHIPLHYLFFYLCTLEIVPLVLLIKALSIVVSGQAFS